MSKCIMRKIVDVEICKKVRRSTKIMNQSMHLEMVCGALHIFNTCTIVVEDLQASTETG